MEVVGGQLLSGPSAQLLLITSASTANSQSIISPLHIFSCHVIKLMDVQSQVVVTSICTGSFEANHMSVTTEHT